MRNYLIFHNFFLYSNNSCIWQIEVISPKLKKIRSSFFCQRVSWCMIKSKSCEKSCNPFTFIYQINYLKQNNQDDFECKDFTLVKRLECKKTWCKGIIERSVDDIVLFSSAMAYVLWRVLMKKYSKVRLGLHNFPVSDVWVIYLVTVLLEEQITRASARSAVLSVRDVFWGIFRCKRGAKLVIHASETVVQRERCKI